MIKGEFKDKKLLIMGGNAETIPLVKMAEGFGIKTIVTSNVSNEPAKKTAWKAYDVDGMDVPGIVSLCREEGVDGILPGVADVLVPAYCKVCEALDLPCYASREIVEVFSYKDVFKAKCEQYGIHGIPEYYLDENLREKDIDGIEFPVMVKPVDSASGQGIVLCNKKEELKEAVEYALSFSKAKRFIVERYMTCDDMGFYYTFKDGVCSASCIYDRYTSDEQPGVSRVCLGGTYPSKHIDEYYDRMHENAIRLFKGIGIKNGVLMLSGFYENGEFYVYDTGFRLQGEAPHLLMKAVNGFDQRELLIRFALTGSEGDLDLLKSDDARFRGKYAATLWKVLKEGTIKDIIGIDNIREDKRVVDCLKRLSIGDTVSRKQIGTERQVFCRIYLVCDSKEELKEALKYYTESIKVLDAYGNDMCLKGFDIEKALG